MNRHLKIPIDINNVRKLQKHNYFTDKDINKILYEKTIILLGCAYKHNSNEALLLMNNNTNEHYYISQNIGDRVYFNQHIIDKLTNTLSNKAYTIIHNHPTDNMFSLGDVNALFMYKKLNLLILVTNSCKYSALLYKTKRLNRSIHYKIISTILKYTINHELIDGRRDASRIISLLQKHGLNYMWFQNY